MGFPGPYLAFKYASRSLPGVLGKELTRLLHSFSSGLQILDLGQEVLTTPKQLLGCGVIAGVYFDTSCVALLRLCCCHLKCLEAQQNKTIPSSKTRKRPVSRNMWRVSNFVVWCAVSRPLRLGLPRIITTDSACRFGRWYQQM